MAITLDGTTGVTAPAFDGTLDATDLTGNVAAARITTALNATGTAPIFACRAWVNFNGTGAVAIRASGNVSSITDNGTGLYTLNFTTAMQDANYSVVASANQASRPVRSHTYATDSVQIQTSGGGSSTSPQDLDTVSVSIFR